MLARTAVLVWTAWLVVIALLLGLLLGGVPHPHFLLLIPAPATMIGAGIALVVIAARNLIRGRDRRRALTLLMLGAAPLWFMSAHIVYGLKAAFTRQINHDLLLDLLIPLGESVFDLEARFRYPARTEGSKVVMISTPFALAREQVEAMDRHVREIEARLGVTNSARVHWMRGPILGMQGKAIFGLCMGSEPAKKVMNNGGSLDYLDRHEVAHCVINLACSGVGDPPALLCEGWAEANSGHDRVVQALSAREDQDMGRFLTLGELIGPDWYGRHDAPVYSQGALLVDYLLKQYGPEKFLKLYATARRGTFRNDCKRILGVDIDDLDAAYQADMKRITDAVGSESRYRLERLALGPQVDPAAWRAFLNEYLIAADRLLIPYQNVKITIDRHNSINNAGGKTKEYDMRFRYARSGAYAYWSRTWKESGEALIADPERSIAADRRRTGSRWTIKVDKKATPEQSYRRMLATIDRGAFFVKTAALLLEISDEMRFRVDASAFIVTKLERYSEGERHFVRVRLEDRTQSDDVPWRSMTVVLSVDDDFAARSIETEDPRGGTSHGEIGYDRHEGVPVPRDYKVSATNPDGSHSSMRETVVERRFGPVAEDEFNLEALLDGPRGETVAEPDRFDQESESFADWFLIPLGCGIVSLGGGIALLFASNRNTKQTDRIKT